MSSGVTSSNDMKCFHGCLLQLVAKRVPISEDWATFFMQYEYLGEKADLDRIDVVTTIGFKGTGEPPEVRLQFWHENIIPRWTKVPGTDWWRINGNWKMPYCIYVTGGSEGIIVLEGAVVSGCIRDYCPNTTTLQAKDLEKYPKPTGAVVKLPREPTKHLYACEENVFDTVAWDVSNRTSLTLALNGVPRMFITPELSDAVRSGVLGSYNRSTGEGLLWLGPINGPRFQKISITYT